MTELEGKIEPGVQIVAKIIGSGPRGIPGKDGEDYVITEADYDAIAESAAGMLQPDVDKAKETAERAEVIAKGRATGYVFDTPEDLEAALANEDFVANLVLGDNFYVRALDVPDYWWDGTQKQQLEAEKPDLTDIVTDVQVNGASIVADGVANIPLCGNNIAGLVSGTNTYSINVSTKGNLRAQQNTLAQYEARDGQAFIGKGTLENIKYDVVKRALSDGTGDAWTAEEQAAARARIGAVGDVQVNGASIVADGVAKIPIGSQGRPGVFGIPGEAYGLYTDGTNNLRISSANNNDITKRSYLKPLSPNYLDFAVKAAMCDGKGAAWTAEEQAAAWSRMSIIKTSMDEIAVAGAQYYLGEQTSVSIILPDDAKIGQMITVSWYNGATAATLYITGTMLEFGYTPSANTRSEVNALWDGTYWTVVGNEMEASSA